MRDRTLTKVKDITVTVGAVVTVLAGFLAALGYTVEARLDPVKSEIKLIREDLRKMNERHERRFVELENLIIRLENQHLAQAPSGAPPENEA
ncbi:MAG: hypothetical protein OXM56_01425 [Gammaproteobacteria bacterium]|nr:hypothetical protein [Gammaproteobacteria bacterium]